MSPPGEGGVNRCWLAKEWSSQKSPWEEWKGGVKVWRLKSYREEGV